MDYSRIIFENAGEDSSFSHPSYAFVGIYARGKDIVFRLPIGYPQPAGGRSYVAARDLHITFFKLFHQFRLIAKRTRERQTNGKGAHEDAGAALKGGREWIVRHDEGEVYYYRHFDAFDSLLDAFDELAILSLQRRLSLTENPPSDLRQFSRTEAGRIYQDDDTFFDDTAFQPLATITMLPSDLVGLYCLLLRDLREHVWGSCDPDPLQDDVRVLAEKFESKYLWPTASCWEVDEWQRTRDTLRDKLDIIDQITAFKDEDYHRLYDAVARFLYPPADMPNGTGMLWGIDGFWPVWEWMVLTRLATTEPFKERLCWVENGNLSSDAVDGLLNEGFQFPLQDERVLCKSGAGWNTFLKNGKALGHPYPDAILFPAKIEQEATPETGWRWIEELTLREGPVVMTLSGMHDYLATTGTTPVEVRIRTTSPPSPPYVDEKKVVKPTLRLTAVRGADLDRPEVFAMLHRLGEWDRGEGAFWRYAPFKSYQDAARKHIGGLLLVDAKYKAVQDCGPQWAADHRKQGAYEDALTISCPDTPAAYSIYICPGQTLTRESLTELIAQEAVIQAQFDREFELQWEALPDVYKYGGVFKQGGVRLDVLGSTTEVAYSGSQKMLAHKNLSDQVFNDLRADLDRHFLARSLLGVSRFPGNDQFFYKNWSIRDLLEDIVFSK